ncbi:hypothetical protein [Paenibacillus rhizophilus]|uniref:Uncharacterized protein n=1 Tax=Paenibacillus rhizophilus TaxID=1850366 RepID=A0A3N9Q2H8_9BACL|nr:hypothetical protein [Paenibacillus rhizophilus]RQW12922.1 hypothetical protein EH198_00370 [Paenibacillus rhizophilus]
MILVQMHVRAFGVYRGAKLTDLTDQASAGQCEVRFIALQAMNTGGKREVDALQAFFFGSI